MYISVFLYLYLSMYIYIYIYTSQVANAVNKMAADLAAWSISFAMSGKAPEKGFAGEELDGYRLEMAGQPLAQGWKYLS